MFHLNIFSTSLLAVLWVTSLLTMYHIEARPFVANVQLPCILTAPSLMLTALSPKLGTLYCRTKDWIGNINRQRSRNEWPWRWTPNIYHGPFFWSDRQNWRIWWIWRKESGGTNMREPWWSRPTCHITHFLEYHEFFPRWHWYKQTPTQPTFPQT